MTTPQFVSFFLLMSIGVAMGSSANPSPLPAAPKSHETDGSVLLVNAQVLDPTGSRFLGGLSVLVDNGCVAKIAPAGEIDVAADVSRIDMRGGWLIPGLIDLHSHLLLHPYDETSWNDQVLRESLELRTLRAVPAARATLQAGFTTLRELGTEGAAFADVALRDAIASGMIEGPRVFAATQALVATGCYGPSGFDPRFELPKGAQVADGVDGVRIAVRQQIAAGADWIKVYADYRRRPGDPSTPTYSQEELNTIVDEATSAGLPVAAHASTDEAIRRAVLAGVKTIEHGYDASDETLALMRDHGVALCPTLAAGYSISMYGGWDGSEPEPPRVASARALMRRALAAGVTIACGSDVGVFSHGENALELELMAKYGMTNAAVLQAATSVAARVLARDDLGRIEEGATADLVVLGQDPHQDVRAFRDVRLVMKGGQLAQLAPSNDEAAAPSDSWSSEEAAAYGTCAKLLNTRNDHDWAGMRECFQRNAILSWDLPKRQSWRANEWIDLISAGYPVPDFRVRHIDPTVRVEGDSATVIATRQTTNMGETLTQLDTILLVRAKDGWKITLIIETGR